MDPFTFFTVLSTVFGAGSKIMQGGAEADAYEAQARASMRAGREKSRVAGRPARTISGRFQSSFVSGGSASRAPPAFSKDMGILLSSKRAELPSRMPTP